jgi:hypothetical protein
MFSHAVFHASSGKSGRSPLRLFSLLAFVMLRDLMSGPRPISAQTLTILHAFHDGSDASNAAMATSPLTLGSDGNFYARTDIET